MISLETRCKERLTICQAITETICQAITETSKTPNLVMNQHHGAKSFLRSY